MKAKDYKRMSIFYESIAQVEIDEYRDYEKAGNCLKEPRKGVMVRVLSDDDRHVPRAPLNTEFNSVLKYPG